MLEARTKGSHSQHVTAVLGRAVCPPLSGPPLWAAVWWNTTCPIWSLAPWGHLLRCHQVSIWSPWEGPLTILCCAISCFSAESVSYSAAATSQFSSLCSGTTRNVGASLALSVKDMFMCPLLLLACCSFMAWGPPLWYTWGVRDTSTIYAKTLQPKDRVCFCHRDLVLGGRRAGPCKCIG